MFRNNSNVYFCLSYVNPSKLEQFSLAQSVQVRGSLLYLLLLKVLDIIGVKHSHFRPWAKDRGFRVV